MREPNLKPGNFVIRNDNDTNLIFGYLILRIIDVNNVIFYEIYNFHKSFPSTITKIPCSIVDEEIFRFDDTVIESI